MRQTIRLAATILVFGLAAFPAEAPAAECSTENPAYEIGPDEAQRLYDCIEAAMIESYSRAVGVPGVPEYRDWRVVSTSPFVSATHGSMMINHIVNPVAAELYTQWEETEGKRFAEGSILAKESYRVTADGEVRIGPLFLMEKVAPGASPETDDWIYTRVFTDGRFQRTLGPGASRMIFCHDCHAATIDDYDAMFFPPKEYRIPVE
ncbi:MAG: cytochrome P460 family protein [Alphaproteobacteria bacterium]